MDGQARLRAMVDEHIDFVERTLRKAGVPPAEVDDEVQRTFMVVARRLDDVDLGAERGFLFQVAINLAAHSRRKLARRREVSSDRLPEAIELFATPERLIERKQTRRLLDEIIDSLHESLGCVFRLSEFEGMNRAEIAAFLGVPRGTVASRLRRARAQIRQHVAAIELAWDLGAAGPSFDGPALLRRQKGSAFGRALLDTGLSTPATRSAHAGTLAALGLS